MKLSNLLDFLASTGAHPQKRLSQNFLIDSNITRKILRAAELEEGDLIVEIGPGPGALTRELVLQGYSLIAVEKDKIFAENLCNLTNVSVFEADILEFNLQEQLERALAAGKKAKVISNLPYHITSPILEKLLPLGDLLSSLTLMVQKEVAERLTAEPATSNYSHLTLFAHFFSNPSYCFTVPPTCFYPRPKVDSAIVRMSLKPAPLPPEMIDQFFSMTRMAFEQRRKMLRSSLKRYVSSSILLESLKESGIAPEARPEELSLEQFLLLFHRIAIKQPDKSAAQSDHNQEQ